MSLGISSSNELGLSFYVQGMEYRTLQMLGKPFITLNIHIKTFPCFVETDTDVRELL